MPRRRPRPPKYRHYRPKNLAVVRIAGRDHYLGKFDSLESYERYDRLVSEWLLTRQSPGGPTVPPTNRGAMSGITVNELLAAFSKDAQRRYVKNGKPTSEFRSYRVARE